jgi:hypothetical protein
MVPPMMAGDKDKRNIPSFDPASIDTNSYPVGSRTLRRVFVKTCTGCGFSGKVSPNKFGRTRAHFHHTTLITTTGHHEHNERE